MTYKNIALLGSVSASGTGGCKFKSCHPDQYLQGATFPGRSFSLSSGPCLVQRPKSRVNLASEGAKYPLSDLPVLLRSVSGTILETSKELFVYRTNNNFGFHVGCCTLTLILPVEGRETSELLKGITFHGFHVSKPITQTT